MARAFDNSETSREIRHVSDAIINLYAAYVMSLLYPYDNPLVSDPLKNAFHCLQKAFHKKKLLHIDSSGGRLFVDGEALDSDIPVFGNFASWMNTSHIKSLSISDELSRRELIGFHKITSNKKQSADQLLKTMAEKSIGSITIQTSTEAEAVSAEASLTGTMSEEDFRKNFLSTMFTSDDPAVKPPEGLESLRAVLLGNTFDQDPGKGVEIALIPIEGAGSQGSNQSGTLSAERTAEELRNAKYVETLLDRDISEEEKKDIRDIPPRQMAHLLNSMIFGAPSDEILARLAEAYLGGSPGENPDRAADDRKEFFRGLRRDIRPLLLRHCESFFSVDELLADHDSKEVLYRPAHEYAFPPSTSHQYEFLDDTGDAPPAAPAAAAPAPESYVPVRTIEHVTYAFDVVANGTAVVHDIELSAGTAALFDENHLSGFRESASFHTLFQQLTPLASGSGTVASLLQECTDDAIQGTTHDAILDLIESDALDGEACQKMTAKLAYLVEAFCDKGELEKVLDVYNALKTHSLQGTHGLQATVMSRTIFSTDQFNAKLVEALRRFGRKQRDSAGKITSALRSYLVPYLLDALSEEPDTSKRRFMIILLTSVSEDVLPHIARRFRDSRWYVLRNLLYLLRECHGVTYARDVREFLEHEVPLVRLEALRTLLSFQDPSADAHVVTFIGSDIFQLQKGAVWLSGTYRIRNSIPHLVALLREKDIFGKKFHLKKMIVRALGRIGDGRALSHLLQLCRSTSMVHKEETDRLKTDIYKTLHNYPMTMIGPLIDLGLQSPIREVAGISRKLAEQYSQSVGRQR